MEQTQYTLAGVMNFLRTEWQQREQTRIEWDIERADLQNRIMRLEAEKIELRRERDEAQRHLEILIAKKLPKQNGTATPSPTTGDTPTQTEPDARDAHRDAHRDTHRDAHKDAPNGTRELKASSKTPNKAPSKAPNKAEPVDEAGLEESQSASDGLMSTVESTREYLNQCIADIRFILRQNGAGSSEAEPLIVPHPGAGSDGMITLANFGSAALAVAVLPDNRVTAGTVDGDLLVWAPGATEARKFGTNLDMVNCIQFSANNNRLLVGAGSSIYVYAIDEAMPSLVTSTEVGGAPVVQLAAAPSGNLLAAVQGDGAATVWSLQEGRKLVKMSEPANGIRVCDFADVGGDLHLVLARNSDPTDPTTAEGNLLLADPLTGQLLKKIVFAANAGISTILLTQDAIVLGTDSGDLRVLGLARGDTLAEITAAHRGEITSLSLLSGGSVISTSIDGRVSVWSIPSLLWKGRLLSHDSGYGALCSSSGGHTTAVGGGDGIIRLYKQL